MANNRDFTMSLRILLLAALLGPSPMAMAQSGTPEEQAACRPDVRRFCYRVKEGDGSMAFLKCLQEHREQLSAGCRAVLDSHGV